MLEKYLIEHCSPTLASIKSGNLFNVSKEAVGDIKENIKKLNGLLGNKGIEIKEIKESKDRVLVYVYRKDKLINDWHKSGVKSFMKSQGYPSIDVDECIDILRKKLMCSEDFPHEIGMFLGYPLGDVIGFIRNKGKNCKCVGCWKVYCDECKAQKIFAQFAKCKRLYKELYNNGRAVTQLAVSA